MITSREIGKSNYMKCICLKVKNEQRGSAADNVRSLAEARFEGGLYIRAVYLGGIMVGFILFDYDPELSRWHVSRFMIDVQYQGRDLSKKAILHFLDFTREYMRVREPYLHVELENTAAHEMYRRLDFRIVREVQYTFDEVAYREQRVKTCL